MGLKFSTKESIGAISHAGGVITLADSLINIGGQQYKTGVLQRTISTDGPFSANTRVNVFVGLLADVPVMRLSQNENSAGPVGFLAWRLVGAIQLSDVDDTFGAFFNIEGIPSTLTYDFDGNEFGRSFGIAYSGIIADQNGTDVQSGSPSTNFRRYHVHGDLVLLSGGYYHTTTPGTTGVGKYGIRTPQNLLIRLEQVTGSNTGIAGFGGAAAGDIGGGAHSVIGAANGRNNNEFHLQIAYSGDSGTWGGNAENTYPMGSAFVGVAWSRMAFRASGAAYKNTPLVDR